MGEYPEQASPQRPRPMNTQATPHKEPSSRYKSPLFKAKPLPEVLSEAKCNNFIEENSRNVDSTRHSQLNPALSPKGGKSLLEIIEQG